MLKRIYRVNNAARAYQLARSVTLRRVHVKEAANA